MNMDYFKAEKIGEDVRIMCDRQNSQSLRQALLRQDIQTTEPVSILFHDNPMSEVVEFNALSVSEDDVSFALDDALKIIRPYPDKSIPKVGGQENPSNESPNP